MNCGKLNEDIHERSVVKVIKDNSIENKKFYDGVGIGDFCAVFPYGGASLISAQASAFGKSAVKRAYEAAVNIIAAKGAVLDTNKCSYALISLFVPERFREIKIRELIAEAARRAEELKVPILSVNVRVLSWIGREMADCAAVAAADDMPKFRGVSPGDDIVMTKWLGLEGTALIARESADKLYERYPRDIIDEAADFGRYALTVREAAAAVKSGAGYMQAAREGGIFGALWELAANNSAGLVADLKSIPVKQETIEICEYFGLNPYALMAGGSLLITCRNGEELVHRLMDENICSRVIGKITDGNDRIIRNGEESRFLEPARGDEIYKN